MKAVKLLWRSDPGASSEKGLFSQLLRSQMVNPRIGTRKRQNHDDGMAENGVTGVSFARKSGEAMMGWKDVVPGGGFEPPTRGFSIRCSTN